ncbi:MAG: alpha-amylase [Mycobacteriaceae bacterium]|nr:alpha-amylase [Mycobacteriaceae bacterium]
MALAWVQHAIWWQVYPLGFVGAYPAAPPPGQHRLRRLVRWFDHAIALGASGIALGPIFASRTHGYDTTDHYRIDARLGDDADFDFLVEQAHRRGLRVLLDGVFNHVGTDFPHSSWFRSGPNGFHTFEGHGELIALDHFNAEVIDYVGDVMRHWLGRGADGWRLDAAYAMPDAFWASVIPGVRTAYPGAWFVGEVIHGDYSARVRDGTFDSVTQYELWKAIWSACNDGNFHELDWALQRHNEFLEAFAPLTFVGNHDVTRIATRLDDPRHLAHAVVILMTVGGVPSIYAGDEFARLGTKEERHGGDDAIRPEFPVAPEPLDRVAEEAFRLHQFLIGLRRRHPWLHRATTHAVLLQNRRYAYISRHHENALLVVLNIDTTPLSITLTDFGFEHGHVLGGAGAPASVQVRKAVVEPNGWLVLRPA